MVTKDMDDWIIIKVLAQRESAGTSIGEKAVLVEALEKARAFPGEIHLLLTDVTMPDMNGIVLAQQILTQRAHIRVLLMSGKGKVKSRLPLLKKPFHTAQLLAQVARVISGPVPQRPAVNADKVNSEAARREGEL
jgi:DNA-binding NtrC family response regulator